MKTEQFVPSTVISAFQPEEAEGGLDVGQLVATLRRRALVIVGVAAVVTGAAWLRALTDTPIYSSQVEILVQNMSAENEVISSVPETLTRTSGESNPKPIAKQDLIKILTSSKELLPVVEKLQKQYPEMTYDSLSRQLWVSPLGKDSNIIQVGYQSADPGEVQAALKELADAYLDYSLRSRQADIQLGLSFVNRKLPDLKKRVEALQEDLQQLRQQNSLIDPESRGQQLSSQVNTFSQQQLEVQAQLQQTRAIAADLRKQLTQQPNQSAASSALAQNPRYQTLLNKLLELDAQIGEASTLYQEASPDMQVLREQRQNLLTLLASEGAQSQRQIISQMRELEAREQALQRNLNVLDSGVDELSGISRSYTDLQRELQVATDNLNQFLTKQAALEIDAAQREVPWELLNPPSEPRPTSADATRNLILGAILGLLLGTGIALLLDKFADVIHASDEIKRITRLPLLGVIPPNDAVEESIIFQPVASHALEPVAVAAGQVSPEVSKNGKSRPYKMIPFMESFRRLYANIRLLDSDAQVRSLVVSSTVAGEGKSTVAACLAQAAAAMGRRVLLVDTDLRNPSIHNYLEFSNQRGLTDVIAGKMDLKDVIQRSPLESNLFVLTAGAVPPDPTRLLPSQRMQQLMTQVESRFDLIIYDTPPLLGFADPYLVAANSDGIVLVTEPGKLKRSLLQQTLEQVGASKVPLLGFVLQKTPTL